MLIITLILMTFNTIIFCFLKNPLSLGSSIIIQTLIIRLIIYLFYSSWFSFILIIIFLRGIMILFSYISALANNKIYFHKTNIYYYILGLRLPLIYNLTYNEKLFLKTNWNRLENNISLQIFKDLYKIYFYNTSTTTIFLILYLLIVLITVTKNVNIAKGPIKFK